MKTYRVGVIGYGWAASAHIPALHATGRARVVAVASSRPLDPLALTAQHGGPVAVYRGVRELLAHPELDVISICSLPGLHAAQAVAAAKAGKHLIIEKPLALNLRDLRAVERAVRRAGVRTCVCFECRYSSQFLAIKSILDAGLLGRVHYGEVDYFHGIGPWYGQFRWNVKQAAGGSSLLSAGCHALDALLLCLGGEVASVASFGTKSTHRDMRRYEYPSTTVTILKFRDGRVGKVASSIDCLQPYYFHTHLIGSEGSLLDNRFHSERVAGLDRHRWSELSMKLLDSGDVGDHPYQTQFSAFFSALDENRDMPLTSLSSAARSHEVIFAADLSAAENRPVQL